MVHCSSFLGSGAPVFSIRPTHPFPSDTPVGDRPTLEGVGLGGGLRLVAVLLGTRSLWPLSSVHVLSAGPTNRTFPNDTPDGDRPTLEGSGLGGDPRLIAVPMGTRSLGHCPRHLILAPDSPSAPAPNDTPDGDRPTLEGSGLGGGPRLVAVLLSPDLRGRCFLHPLAAVGHTLVLRSVRLASWWVHAELVLRSAC